MPAAPNEWFDRLDQIDFTLAATLLGLEVAIGLMRRRMSWHEAGDMLASIGSQIPFFLTGFASYLIAVAVYYTLWQITPVHLPVNGWTVAAALILADFAYYWEHRAGHRIRLLWTSHAVHHSSPYMNTAVAFRFGPLEAFPSLIFMAPIVLLGFDPVLVLLLELAVLVYQVWLHTELIGRLGFLDKIFNTPSNHRVHHGSNDAYLDRNYGGILILWDRLFGTYAREEEKPVYGLTRQINSINPLVVWFSEWPGLARDLWYARSPIEAAGYLFRPPGWTPADNSGEGGPKGEGQAEGRA